MYKDMLIVSEHLMISVTIQHLSNISFNSYDATAEPNKGCKLGRLVNHGVRKEINAKMKVLKADGKPALCLFALKDILPGHEILYDYGQKDYPWLKKKVNIVEIN